MRPTASPAASPLGGEALHTTVAMNSGHHDSECTVHLSGPREPPGEFRTALMAGRGASGVLIARRGGTESTSWVVFVDATPVSPASALSSSRTKQRIPDPSVSQLRILAINGQGR